jgi:zinc D-Ala-D-Ala carboxypeptidase
METMKLSNSFNLIEFTSSETASRRGIDNTPSIAVIENLKLLCENVLQPLRDKYGKSINITSGYRSPKLNKAIGGSATSQHCFGQAADIQVDKKDYLKVWEILKSLPFDQIIWEFGNESAPDWIHVSYVHGKNRCQKLKAVKSLFGKTEYLHIK